MGGHGSQPINREKLFQILRKFIKGSKLEISQPCNGLSCETTELPSTLPGLNLAEALERIGIAPEVFKTILLKFAENNAGRDREFVALLEQNDLDGLVVASHTLKGAAANIGASNLHESCLEVEMAAKERRATEEILDLVGEVGKSLEVVLTSLDGLRA